MRQDVVFTAMSLRSWGHYSMLSLRRGERSYVKITLLIRLFKGGPSYSGGL